MNKLSRTLWVLALSLSLLIGAIYVAPANAASTCAGFIPATITTPTNLIDAVNAAQSGSCPGADVIDLAGATITFTNSTFTDGAENLALPAITTPITITDGTITRSSATGFKFLLVNTGGNLTLNNLTLSNGGGTGISIGGAVHLAGSGNLTVTNTTFLNNTSPGYGGGAILANGSGVVTISDTIFRGNQGGTDAGAIIIQSFTSLTIDRTQFLGNVSSGVSVLSLSNTGTTIIRDSLFAGNYSSPGSTIVTSSGTSTFTNVTIAGNVGRGIGSNSGIQNYQNVIIWGNSSVSFGGNSPTVVAYSAAAGYAGATINTGYTVANFFVNPLTTPSAANTGLNYNPALYDWQLRSNSPAIDAAQNTVASTSDLNGAPRRFDDTNVADTGNGTAPIVDMGAYERQLASQLITLQFNGATSSAAEAAGFGNLLRVTTSDGLATEAAATVTVAPTGGTATAADYNLTGTITIPAGTANNALVSIASGITVTNENLAEPNETIQLTLSAPAGAVLGAQTTITHTINNDDVATVTIADVAQAEGNAGTSTMTFTVTVDNPVQNGFALDYTTTNLTAATGDSDYVLASGTLIFAGTAGESQTIDVTINADTKVEANETFRVSFPSAASTVAPGALIITDTATGTINNDDTAAVTIADVAIAEGNAGTSLLTFTATLDNAVAGSFTVNYVAADGTATIADNDYSAATGTLTFTGTAGETQTFSVTINGDTKVELNETFTVSLNTVSNAAVNITDTAAGTINNDDSAAVTIADVAINEGNAGTSNMIFTATLNNAVAGGFTVNYATADGTASAGSDYVGATGTLTFAGTAGETRTFVILINGDTVVEANETFTVSLNTVSNAAVNIADTAVGTINNNDAAAVTIANVTQPENGTFTFTATLSNATSASFSVDWALAAGTTNAADYVGGVLPAGGTLTFVGTAGETRTFTVPVLDDAAVELSETFTISMTNFLTAGGFVVDVTDTATGTITDNDSATVTIADVAIAEGNAGTSLITFTATLNNAVAGGFTVNYATANGTATAGSDYVNATGTLTFAGTAGETQTFTVTVNGDTTVEANETFTVSLNTVSNAAVNITDTATGTINNDDTATVTIADVAIAEGNAGTSLMTFTATLNNAVVGGFTVNYATANGTAIAGSDYVNATGTLTFVGTAGETQTFSVTINGDTTVELNETFTVSLNTVSNAAVNITDTAAGTITNDDVVPAAVTIADVAIAEGNAGTSLMTFTVTLDNAVSGGFTVNYATANGTATAGSDYVNATGTLTFAGTAGETQTFTVTINGDTTIEPNETFTVSLNTVSNAAVNITDTATGTINNDDSAAVTIADVAIAEGNAGTSNLTFTVTLDNAVPGGFTVNYATTNGTATTGDNDYVAAIGTLTFVGTAGETQTFTVTVNGDTTVEANETFTVSLNTVSNAVVNITDTATGTINNDDTAGYLVDTTATAANIGEPSTSTTFTIRLSTLPTGTVILDFGSTDTTECTVTPANFTFNAGNWNVAQTITITAADDLIADGTQPCAATITRNAGSSAAEYNAVANPANVTLNVTDNETAGITVGTPSSASINELGGITSSNFTVVLTTQPTADVSIPLSSSDTTECSVSAPSLTFTTVNWNVAQTVTITSVDDFIADGNQPCIAQIGVIASADPVYNGIDPADVTVTVVDNEIPGLTLSAVTVTEGAGSQTYTIQLNTQPTADVQITTITPDAQCTISGVTLPLTFTAVNWNVPQTVTVTAVDDAAIEGNHACVVTHSITSADAGYAALVGVAHTVTVIDNDVAPLIPTPTTVVVDNSGQPQIGSFDPAISKVGVLMPGELGLLGERLSWQITVYNRGTAVGTNVIFTDTLRTELRVDEVTTSRGTSTISGQTVTVNIGNVGVGETINITIVTTVLQSDISVNNTGCVTSDTTASVCVTSASLRTEQVTQLPSTGENPLWVNLMYVGVLLVVTGGLVIGVRRLKRRAA